MSDAHEYVVRGGTVVSSQGCQAADVRIRGDQITELGPELEPGPNAELIDAAGHWVFAGIVDTQVHFREPGLGHKEDLASGSLAALAGGVTSFCEMPNTSPSTTTPEALQDKLHRAEGRSFGNYAFFLGAADENAEQLAEWENAPGCAGIKVFMGSSTGSLLVEDDATLERVLRSGKRRVAIHSEDEPLLRASYAQVKRGSPYTVHPEVRSVESAVRSTTRLLDLVEKTGRKVHLLHVSTAEEIELVRERDLGELVSVELTPNHLFLEAPGCYESHGSLVQMNPPVRERRHSEALRQAAADGTAWTYGSDHAPHTLAEKLRPYPLSPSGIPGVQTSLPLFLTAVRDGWLQLEDVARLMCEGPCRVYDIAKKGHVAPGYDADLTIVDPSEMGPLREDWLRSRAGYSPFVGRQLAGWPVTVLVGGEIAYHQHRVVTKPRGRPLEYRLGEHDLSL
jgi:dihydroorotase